MRRGSLDGAAVRSRRGGFRAKRTALLAATVLAAFATCAGAAEAGSEHHGPSWALTLLGFVNFAIYIWILRRFAWPLVTNYLHERRDSVVEALAAAARARTEAEELKAEYEAKMRNVEIDAAQTRNELLAVAQLEAKQLLDQAKRSAERLKEDAKLVADQEVARARRLLQEESARLISEMAGEIVSRQLTNDDEARFIEEFLAQARTTAAGERASERAS
jgi:F-type H+-transporting ATPase subunit b